MTSTTTTAGRMTTMMGSMGSGMMMMPMPPMMPGMMPMGMGMPATGSMGQMAMVPRCTVTMSKTADGVCFTCTCEDKASAAMLQNLCMSMGGQMMGCCMMMNGQCCLCCNMAMGMCRTEMTEMGVKMMCTSGDADCVKMMHACCDCCMAMMKPGMMCCMMMGGMPMCCMMC